MAAERGTLDIRLECVGWGDTTLLLCQCRHKAVKVDCGMDHSIAETSNVCPVHSRAILIFSFLRRCI